MRFPSLCSTAALLLAPLLLTGAPFRVAALQNEDHPSAWVHPDIAESKTLDLEGGSLQIDLAAGHLDLPPDAIFRHVQKAASAVLAYYGKLPVTQARMLILPAPGRSGVMQGTTWGGRFGVPGFTRIRLGEHTTQADLEDDWMTTHELVHLGFPSLPDDQHWMEEGMATYIEPVARVMTGELDAHQIWHDMVRDMPKGEPQPGDQGLEHTHTWGRTYWGGALFCLVADVTIRRETGNRKGLQDAMRAIVNAGGTIDHDWPLDRALEIGDRATGTHVLTRLYADWKNKPVTVNLPELWSELGVIIAPDGSVTFRPDAPQSAIREAITARH